jgi:hypothetical protein
LWSAQSVKSKKLLKLSKKGCTFGRKRDNFKIGIQSVIHLYGIFNGLNTKKQENQGFRKNGWFPFAPTTKFKTATKGGFSFVFQYLYRVRELCFSKMLFLARFRTFLSFCLVF